MGILGKIFVAILLVPLSFFALVLTVFIAGGIFVTIDDFSKRCKVPSISSEEQFKVFALEKMLSLSETAGGIYQSNILMDPNYVPPSSSSYWRWSWSYWSHIRGATFRLLDPPGQEPSRYRAGRPFQVSFTVDECGRVLGEEIGG